VVCQEDIVRVIHSKERQTIRMVLEDILMECIKCAHLESFEMWCWRRMEVGWTDNVRNEEVSLRVKEQRNILHEISKQKTNWNFHILRRNCLL
jgi:hypothetical protein